MCALWYTNQTKEKKSFDKIRHTYYQVYFAAHLVLSLFIYLIEETREKKLEKKLINITLNASFGNYKKKHISIDLGWWV